MCWLVVDSVWGDFLPRGEWGFVEVCSPSSIPRFEIDFYLFVETATWGNFLFGKLVVRNAAK